MKWNERYPPIIKSMPDLVEHEWDYEKNNAFGIFPDEICRTSNVDVFWKCDAGHSWRATPANRTKKKKPTGCHICMAAKSFGEFSVFFYLLNRYGSDNVNNRVQFKSLELDEKNKKRRFEVDIYVKPLKLIVEHDGRFHSGAVHQRLDKEKDEILRAKGYKVVRFKALKNRRTEDSEKYSYKEGNFTELETAIKEFIRDYTDIKEESVDIKRDTMKILSLYYPKEHIPCEKDDERLVLATEWDFEANEGFSIFNFLPSASYYASWICRKCKNKWISLISNRVKRGCPACKGQRQSEAYAENLDYKKSFAYLCKEKMPLWNREKNSDIGLFPHQITPGSAKYAYWKCTECENEWYSAVWTVAESKKNGCRKCGIESARRSKYKEILMIDPKSGGIVRKFPSAAAAKNEGFRHPDRGYNTGKIYKGYIWKLADNM